MANLTSLLFNSAMLPAIPAFLAQTSGADVAVSAGVSVVQLLIFAVTYAFVAFCGMTILQKLNYENPWMAWIPVVNNYAFMEAGEVDSPLLWTLLFFVPCVNLISLFKLIQGMINICNQLGKTPWILLAVLIPLIGAFVTFGYLAFA